MATPGKQLIGYITVETRENYFRGAALVTDARGIPADFRYTEPVRPTKLERILYGGALDVYLREEVILDNLISAVESKPILWLVDDEDLIKPVQKIARIPVIAVSATQRAPLEQSGLYEPTPENGAFVLQADNLSAPLRIVLTEENAAQIQQFAQTLTATAEEMELLEPFSRIMKAIDAVAESERK